MFSEICIKYVSNTLNISLTNNLNSIKFILKMYLF